MSWLFGNNKKNAPQATNLQTQKTKQIETLQRINASVSEILRDVEYRVTFPVSGINYTLIINLPSQFPQMKPTVSVEPMVQHPWVDGQMNVAQCPALLGFSMHSSLGAAIQSIIDEFRARPPRPFSQMPASQLNYSGPLTCPPGSSQQTFAAPLMFQQPRHSNPSVHSLALSQCDSQTSSPTTYFYAMPPLPPSFQQLAGKSAAELSTLLNDEDKLQQMLEGLPELKKIADDKESASKRIAELAKSNLAMKPQLDNLKKDLHSQISKLVSLQNSLDAQRSKYGEIEQQFKLSHILTNLKVAVLEADEESESIAEHFLKNKIETDEFCRTFLDKRAVCHSRRVKEEKLQQIMMSQSHMF